MYRLAHRLLALANAALPASSPPDDPLANGAALTPRASTSRTLQPQSMDETASGASPRDSRSLGAHDLSALSDSRATELRTKLQCLLQDFMAQVSGGTQDAPQLSDDDGDGLQEMI